jgi:hypothetical protein
MIHPSDEQLNDYIERELGPADHADVTRHVDVCPDCARVIAELQQILRDAASLEPMAPPAHVWKQVERRVRATPGTALGGQEPGQRADGRGQEAKEARQRAAADAQAGANVLRRPAAASGAQARGQGTWRTQWGPAWALATAALVIVAFLTGRMVEYRARPSAPATDGGAYAVDPAVAANVRERVLLVAVGDHLERSQMVLVELANAHTRGALDISAERQSADELLASNRLYRQTAAQIGETSVADLLDNLERVLVEVANGPSQISMQELAAIQQRIEAQGILFKVKIISSDIRERGNSTTLGRKQPVS